MQQDMHYYGTYALARAAGLNQGAAQTIATAAEYVDDSDYVDVELEDEVFIHAPPTAHHPANKQNVEPVDQRRVWVPFHFLPGGEGDSLSEQLVCRMDSAIAKEMVEFHLNADDDPLERIGIAAHVYADTFSHYGFSGIASPWNQVFANSIELHVKSPDIFSYLTGKYEGFRDKYVAGGVANLLGLGHGSVATYPDRPYLVWSFRYQFPLRDSGLRRNPETFLKGAEALYGMFRKLAEAMPAISEAPRPFASIKDAIAKILAVEADMEDRIDAWRRAAVEGALFGPVDGEEIPRYNSGMFEEDITLMSQNNRGGVVGTNGYAFLKAAKAHRDFVLFDLLPKHGMTVLEPL
jgi:hypothetical protein